MKNIEVVASVIIKDGMVFATQRGYGEYKDRWEFPGGKIEPGETKENALIREIKEELDTDIAVHELIRTVEYDYPKFHLIMHCFLCSVLSGNLSLQEHEDFRWLTENTIYDIDWLPADKAVLENVVPVLQAGSSRNLSS